MHTCLLSEPETFGFKSSMKSEEIDGGETERQITSQNSNAQPNSAAEVCLPVSIYMLMHVGIA